MARLSEIDKKIAELEAEVEVRQLAITILRSVQTRKPAKVKKERKPKVGPGDVVA